MEMRLPRSAGILLHPTSLPGRHGIGELGDEAYRFLDFLGAAHVRLWQMLPLGPTGYGDSPYQCFSAFAGNPLLIAVPGPDAPLPAHEVDFARVVPLKRALVDAAIDRFEPDDAFHAFVAAQAYWLPDYALFAALKDAHGGRPWTAWDAGAARREPGALASWRARLAPAIHRVQVEQFLFASQFVALRRASAARGIQLVGDLPIYVAHDSADVWAHPELFLLRDDGSPAVQAGVPPDYFSATGQLWGNPLYNWEAMERTGFAWWIERMRHSFAAFDLVRIDHFRGFEAFWEVPGDAVTAAGGRWVKGPGEALFGALEAALGPLPVIAENLGVITPAVERLRQRYGLPGMHIMQFSFGPSGDALNVRPRDFPPHSVVYTGTHDNDTTVGWWYSTGADDSTRDAAAVAAERAEARVHLDTTSLEIHWAMIQAAMATASNTAIIPMQDVLGLGSEARMNRPGRPDGNWRWRFSWDQVTPAITAQLRALVVSSVRDG